jgi:hypothetical protein
MFYEIHTGNRLAGYFPGTAKKKIGRDFKGQPYTTVQDVCPEKLVFHTLMDLDCQPL